MVDTHMTFRRLMQERGVTAVSGEVSFHTSGVPCLSCVGVATQFKRCYPQVAFNFTFSPREVVEGPDVAVAVAPHTPRLVPGAPSDGAAGKGKGKAAASAEPPVDKRGPGEAPRPPK
ncbi:unnamed protein product [Prorocentrum cordatum]|uniref:Uncharacterized protein n=1 Tax=Prorocentrum cordatum TaxID=2364126 RepID=A0ABN9WG84_9DINO|nr:unnamed protein product [Polarella glacialis]